jgi:hypothetical protein
LVLVFPHRKHRNLTCPSRLITRKGVSSIGHGTRPPLV